jgi:hypothetical protein
MNVNEQRLFHSYHSLSLSLSLGGNVSVPEQTADLKKKEREKKN